MMNCETNGRTAVGLAALIAIAACWAQGVGAQEAARTPGEATGDAAPPQFVEPAFQQPYQRDKRAADEAYAAGRFTAAYDLYLQKLAPLGDKYAHYMIGYMHLRGEGAQVDPPYAAGWLALAAERGDAQVTALHTRVLAALSDAQREDAVVQRAELLALYGDCAATRVLAAREEKALRDAAGVREAARLAEVDLDAIEPAALFGVSAQTVLASLVARQAYLDARCE